MELTVVIVAVPTLARAFDGSIANIQWMIAVPFAVWRATTHIPRRWHAVVEWPEPEQAVEVASRLLRLHEDLVPHWEVECDVRQVVTHCLP